ncbi:MAG TPA: hypothetical protein PLP25_12405, partial [Candidatus Limiplasma sp.]|nr:hypothetical protein [Candidatus Limiplasma sp.]HPS82648.1 hypothetical protein [Candidatus Limiplasma sp.]
GLGLFFSRGGGNSFYNLPFAESLGLRRSNRASGWLDLGLGFRPLCLSVLGCLQFCMKSRHWRV